MCWAASLQRVEKQPSSWYCLWIYESETRRAPLTPHAGWIIVDCVEKTSSACSDSHSANYSDEHRTTMQWSRGIHVGRLRFVKPASRCTVSRRDLIIPANSSSITPLCDKGGKNAEARAIWNSLHLTNFETRFGFMIQQDMTNSQAFSETRAHLHVSMPRSYHDLVWKLLEKLMKTRLAHLLTCSWLPDDQSLSLQHLLSTLYTTSLKAQMSRIALRKGQLYLPKSKCSC